MFRRHLWPHWRFASKPKSFLRRPGFYSSSVIGLSGALVYLFDRRILHLDTSDQVNNHEGNAPVPLEQTRFWPLYDGLREYESSYLSEYNTGVSRYDVVQVPSNNPMEDYHEEIDFSTPSGYWSFYVVLDGHQGWQTSAWLKSYLIHAVAGFVGDVYTRYEPLFEEHSHIENTSLTHENPRPPSAAIDNAIKDAFKSLDDDIVERAVEAVFASTSKADAVRQLAPACAGSSALLAFYERRDRLLRIAITGDSRAVLGRRTKSSESGDLYEVHVLSVKPHTQNAVEGIQLSPFPKDRAIREGQISGSGRSRSFGDAAYKWSAATRTRLSKEYLWKKPPLETTASTPLTAEPEITTTEIQPGDFLILGTNGLWESLTSEEAVGLVGWWLLETEKTVQKKKRREDLPVLMLQERTAPVTHQRWGPEKEFVNVDRNAATHLARNALGGADFDLTEALLNVAAPHTRRYRDDLTAIVVFFDEE